jgi:hypothetical protein
VNGKDSLVPAALLLIIGGRQRWPGWLAGTGHPDIYVRTFLASPTGPHPPEPQHVHDR